MSCWIKVVTRRAFYFLAETSFQKTNRWNKNCWKMFSWCLICWMNLFPVRSSGAAAQRTCQREVIEGHAVLHLVPLQLLLVQRRQRSRQIFHRGRRRVWRYEQTQVQMFVQVLNVIINIMNETKRHSANSQWGAAAGAAPPSALLPRLHQQLVHQSVSDRLLRQPLSTGRRHLRRTGDNNVFITKTTFSNVCPSQ